MSFRRLSAALLVLLLLAAASGRVYARASGKEDHGIRVRVLGLSGTFEDHPSAFDMDPMTALLGGGDRPKSFYALCDRLDGIATCPDIDDVLLDLRSPTLSMNLAQVAEFGRHLQQVRDAGKGTIAWLENAGVIPCVLAAGCDTVLMADMGMLDIPSLGLSTMHFKRGMDLLGVRASVVRAGDYKGAVEPYTLEEMSPHLREHYRKMIATMNDFVVDRIAKGRNLDPEVVRAVQSDRFLSAKAARKAGLVDELVPFGGERDAVRERLQGEVEWVEPARKARERVSFFELMDQLMGGGHEGGEDEPVLAVLHLQGTISDGDKEVPGSMVSGPTVREIHRLGEDDKVRAVVVRINSPGGSASASEAIRQALAGLAAAKPVAVSMGSVAASGGYWITCFGSPIWAEPGTLTGSIGAFAMKLDFGPLLDKMGIKIENVTLDESAGAMSLDRPWSAGEKDRLGAYLQDAYHRFLGLVATSRSMTVEDVEPIAGGRVWSGAQAQGIGLIDHLGGVQEAVAALREQAGLDASVSVVHRPRPKSLFETLDMVFGDPDDEVLWSARQRTALRLLHERGFRLELPLAMLRGALEGSMPRVWLVEPREIVIR